MAQGLRDRAVAMYREGLSRITPEYLMRSALALDGSRLVLTFLDRTEAVDLSADAGIHVISIGKAAAPMAAAAQALLGRRVVRGLIVTKYGFALPQAPWPQLESGHPVPDANGVRAAQAVEEFARSVPHRDILIVLMSGGASALLPAPLAGISLEDKQHLVQQMLRADMDIHEINRVRKSISRLKGGGLAAAAGAGTVVGLYLSDVPGDDIASVGSGPTVPEPVDARAVIRLLQQKALWDDSPKAVRSALETGEIPPKVPRKPPINGLIGTNRYLLRAIQAEAEQAGFVTKVVEEPLTGLNRDALPKLFADWRGLHEASRGTGSSARHPAVALIRGGETTVQVRGTGLGGRCQELAALALPELDVETVLLAAGSDGNDGPTDAAGGVVDRDCWLRIASDQIPYDALLDNNDSYHLLERIGALIRVPPTRNNVMDVYVLLSAGSDPV